MRTPHAHARTESRRGPRGLCPPDPPGVPRSPAAGPNRLSRGAPPPARRLRLAGGTRLRAPRARPCAAGPPRPDPGSLCRALTAEAPSTPAPARTHPSAPALTAGCQLRTPAVGAGARAGHVEAAAGSGVTLRVAEGRAAPGAVPPGGLWDPLHQAHTTTTTPTTALRLRDSGCSWERDRPGAPGRLSPQPGDSPEAVSCLCVSRRFAVLHKNRLRLDFVGDTGRLRRCRSRLSHSVVSSSPTLGRKLLKLYVQGRLSGRLSHSSV